LRLFYASKADVRVPLKAELVTCAAVKLLIWLTLISLLLSLSYSNFTRDFNFYIFVDGLSNHSINLMLDLY
jgi:hypothetical protein